MRMENHLDFKSFVVGFCYSVLKLDDGHSDVPSNFLTEVNISFRSTYVYTFPFTCGFGVWILIMETKMGMEGGRRRERNVR